MCKLFQPVDSSEAKEQRLDDAPITLLEEDKFDRKQFVKNLVSALIPRSQTNKGTESKVLALTGTWGVGKTSVINMVRRLLQEENRKQQKDQKQKLYIIDFNPWQYTKKDDLIKPLLEELFLGCNKEKEVLKKECKQENRELNKLRKKIAKYYKNFDFSSVKESLIALVASVEALLGFVALFSKTLVTLYIILSFGLLLGFIFSLRKLIKTWLKNEIDSKKISQLKQKEDISDYIGRKKIYFLIIIDDIDRLTPDETLQIFRIIRTNADFKNTTYLLSFYKSAVIKNLNSINIDGEGFIEKIITLDYVLPKPPAFYIRKYIDEGLREILKQKNNRQLLDLQNENFKYNEIIKVLAETLSTMRDIKRFLNFLSLHMNVLINDGIAEVNFIDLALLECILLKHRDCYYGIQNNKIILTKTKEEHEKENITLETIRTAIKGFAKTDIELKLVLWLFPTVYYAFEDEFDLAVIDYKPGHTYHSHICSPNYFDIYFSTGINVDDPEHISNKDISEFIGVSFDKDKMVEFLKKWLQTDKFLHFIDILRDICQVEPFIPKDNASAFIATMFDAQCLVPYEQKVFFEINMRDICKEIILSYLKNFHQETKNIIIKAIKESQFGYPAAAFFFHQEKLCQSKHTDVLFRENDIPDIKKAVLDKLITYKQESGEQFWADDDLENILGFWHTLDSWSFDKEMKTEVITDKKLCDLMINLYKMRLHRDKQYFPYRAMEYFGKLKEFEQRLQNAVNISRLGERQLSIVNYFIKNFQFRDAPYMVQLQDNSVKAFDEERNNDNKQE